MRHHGPAAIIALLAVFAIGCESAPVIPSTAITAPSPSREAGVPSPSARPTRSPAASPTPEATASPAREPSMGWTRIRWRELAADDPLATARLVTPWRGGYVAVGRELVSTGQPSHTQVSVSSDGAAWTALPADTFGSGSAVISVAPSRDGVVALTLELAGGPCDEPPDDLACHGLIGPLQAWTSTDGTSWAMHLVPDVHISKHLIGQDGDYPVLEPGVAPLLLVRSHGRWRAVSDDGVTWDQLAAGSQPRRSAIEAAAATSGGYIGVGNAGFGTGAIGAFRVTSPDGRHWTTSPIRAGCGTISGSQLAAPLTAGQDGMIAQGFSQLESGAGVWTWCSSPDGRHWHAVDGYPPLGAWNGRDECRDVCPNGLLVGDGAHLIAYGGGATQAAWSSMDGLNWAPLAVKGSEPARQRSGRYYLTMQLLPLGVLAQGNHGRAWVGKLLP